MIENQTLSSQSTPLVMAMSPYGFPCTGKVGLKGEFEGLYVTICQQNRHVHSFDFFSMFLSSLRHRLRAAAHIVSPRCSTFNNSYRVVVSCRYIIHIIVLQSSDSNILYLPSAMTITTPAPRIGHHSCGVKAGQQSGMLLPADRIR